VNEDKPLTITIATSCQGSKATRRKPLEMKNVHILSALVAALLCAVSSSAGQVRSRKLHQVQGPSALLTYNSISVAVYRQKYSAGADFYLDTTWPQTYWNPATQRNDNFCVGHLKFSIRNTGSTVINPSLSGPMYINISPFQIDQANDYNYRTDNVTGSSGWIEVTNAGWYMGPNQVSEFALRLRWPVPSTCQWPFTAPAALPTTFVKSSSNITTSADTIGDIGVGI